MKIFANMVDMEDRAFNLGLQQRTKVRNSAQIRRVEPGPVSALQGSMLFEFCVRDVRVCGAGLPLMSLCYMGAGPT